jgi:hypothetical protein
MDVRKLLWACVAASACGSDAAPLLPDAGAAAPLSYFERAGDGTQALRKLAEVWCERLIACAAEAQLGTLWADRQTCVREQSGALFDDALALGCGYEHDLTIAADPLVRCMQAIGDAACPRIAPVAFPLSEGALLQLSFLGGQLRACRDAERALLHAQDAVYGRAAEGAPCDAALGCGQALSCVAGANACGTCVHWPLLGEPCRAGEDVCFCDIGLEPGPDGICQSVGGGEGDSCGQCNPGLDCVSGSCAAAHHEGDLCAQEADCGDWLHCLNNRCTYKLPYGSSAQFAGIGVACSQDSQDVCAMGRCSGGKCVDRGGLGDSCDASERVRDRQCQLPYSCLHGVCAAGPACGSGQDGAACERSWQCTAGSGCMYNDGAPQVCRALGRPSLADAGCACGSLACP